MFFILKVASIFLLLGSSFTISAKLIGVIGQTYPISEENFVRAVKNKIQEKIKNGEWAQWQAQQTMNLQNASRPTPDAGLTAATENRSWYYDPTISITTSMRKAGGQVLTPRNTEKLYKFIFTSKTRPDLRFF